MLAPDWSQRMTHTMDTCESICLGNNLTQFKSVIIPIILHNIIITVKSQHVTLPHNMLLIVLEYFIFFKNYFSDNCRHKRPNRPKSRSPLFGLTFHTEILMWYGLHNQDNHCLIMLDLSCMKRARELEISIVM